MEKYKKRLSLCICLCLLLTLIAPLVACDKGTEMNTDISLTVPTTPSTEEPTEPAPTEPAPTEPAPTEPAPTEPDPTEPAPTEPAPTEPTPTEPPLPEIDTLPRIDITTEGGAPINSKDVYTPSSITVSNCPDFYAFENISAGVRLRGNSTAGAPKAPYRIKFDKKQAMLGLNGNHKFKSWVLLADYFDSSMLRTFSTFNMATILLEGKYYSSDCIPVEVYINGQYNGMYLLCEQTQMNKNRIDIPEKEDLDTSLEIGYLLVGQGGRTDEPNSVVINMDMLITDREGVQMYVGGGNFSLSGGDYTPEQMAYVENYLNAVYEVIDRALNNNVYYTLDRQCNLTLKNDFVGTTEEEKQIETIDAVFNIDAAVRLCILDEIVKNLDAGTYNMYVDLSPTGDGRLTLGAPWDFDFALGNTYYHSTHSTYGYYATNFTYSAGMRVNVVYVLFGKLPWFEDRVREVWQAHYDELYEFAESLPLTAQKFGDAYQRDFEYWNRAPMIHHCTDCYNAFATHADTVDFLHNWLCERLEWLNKKWGENYKDYEDEAPPCEPIEFDFSNVQSAFQNVSFIYGMNDAEYAVTSYGIMFKTLAGYDPYFSLALDSFGKVAEDYGTLEIEYMLPVSNLNSSYPIEVFLCAGNYTHAVAGVSVTSSLGSGDGVWHKISIDLSACPQWTGNIHAVRIDFFSISNPNDAIFIKSISLTK